MIGGRVLDHTALLAMAAGTSEYADALLAVATELGIVLAIPTTSLQAAWAVIEPADRPWLDQLPAAATAVVVDLDTPAARESGLLAARAGLASAHPAAAHAALVGISRGWPVVTKAPDVLLALSTDVRTETIP